MANSHMTFGVDLLPKTTNTYSLGNSSQKWKVYPSIINQAYTGTGTVGQAGSATAAYKPSLWTFNLGITPVAGDIITIKIPVAGVNAGIWLSVDNGTNYYPIATQNTGRLTTEWSVNQYITLVYETGMATSLFGTTKDGAAAGATEANVTMNRWRVLNYYNTNTTYSVISKANIISGTETTGCLVTAARMRELLDNLGGTNLTLTKDSTKGLILNHDASGVTATSTEGMYKVKYDAQGHITGATAMAKADITGLLGLTPTANTGTITGIKMNGVSKGTSGIVDLGTVITAHQDISGKVSKSGDTLSGNINRYYASASTDPMFKLVSYNQDAIFFDIGHGGSAAATPSSNYQLKYIGTGSDSNNMLVLVGKKGSTAYEIFKTNQTGTITFTGTELINNTTAASTTKGSSQLQVANSGGGVVGIELRRGDLSSTTNGKGSWQIVNDDGNLIIREDYKKGAQTATYENEILRFTHNSGNITAIGTITAAGFIGNASTATNVAWAGITNKPTTLSGYGITDAKIASGTITLGSNTITPLTSQYTTRLYVNATAGGATSNATTANTTTYLHLYDSTTKRDTVQLKGSGATTVSATNEKVITINSTDSKVQQNASNTTNWRKVTLGYSGYTDSNADVGNGVTNQLYTSKNISAQTSTGTLRASRYRVEDNVELRWNDTDKSLDFIFI